MTLLIALIANEIFAHLTGVKYIDTGWIVLLWVIHVVYHSETSSKKK